MKEFPQTDRTKITRLPKRGSYEKETIYSILDEALYCTIAYNREGIPFQIPTGFCRIKDKLYIHGSVGSFYMRELAQNQPTVSIGITLMDGLVLARSAFHHSANYRSVVIFTLPEVVSDEQELSHIMEAFTDKMCPGRWADVREPNTKEWKATMVLAFDIKEASAKIRTGDPKDEEEDYDLDVWAGVVPLKTTLGTPIPDPNAKKPIALPDYLQR